MKLRYISLLFLFTSCSTKTVILGNGITKIPKDVEVFKNKPYFTTDLLKLIDTSAIYRESYSYLSNEDNSFEPLNDVKSYRVDNHSNHYKFYSNGFFSLFSKPIDKTLKDWKPDPNYEGYKGIYYIKNKNLYLDLYTIISYGIKPNYGIKKSQILIKADTILIKDLNSPRTISVNIKRRLK